MLALASACNNPPSTTGPASPKGSPSTTPSASAPEQSTPGPSTPEPSTPADPRTIAGTGYAFVPPSGWTEATQKFQGYNASIDTAAAESDPADPAYSDNVNVLTEAAVPADQIDKLRPALVAELRKVASDVTAHDDVSIDDLDALHYTAMTSAGSSQVITDQYDVPTPDAFVIITFSFDPKTPAAVQQRDVESTLGSWHWDDEG